MPVVESAVADASGSLRPQSLVCLPSPERVARDMLFAAVPEACARAVVFKREMVAAEDERARCPHRALPPLRRRRALRASVYGVQTFSATRDTGEYVTGTHDGLRWNIKKIPPRRLHALQRHILRHARC